MVEIKELVCVVLHQYPAQLIVRFQFFIKVTMYGLYIVIDWQ